MLLIALPPPPPIPRTVILALLLTPVCSIVICSIVRFPLLVAFLAIISPPEKLSLIKAASRSAPQTGSSPRDRSLHRVIRLKCSPPSWKGGDYQKSLHQRLKVSKIDPTLLCESRIGIPPP